MDEKLSNVVEIWRTRLFIYEHFFMALPEAGETIRTFCFQYFVNNWVDIGIMSVLTTFNRDFKDSPFDIKDNLERITQYRTYKVCVILIFSEIT